MKDELVTPSLLPLFSSIGLMSGKQFFIKRYEKLGWNYEQIKPKLAIRINTLNGSKDEIVSRLESLGIALEKIPFLANGYWINRGNFSLGATAEYLLGLYSIQETASQIPATLFTRLNDRTVLDACASPGGKTVQLANLMNNSGVIVALELKQHKMFAISNQLERNRVKNAAIYNWDARKASKLGIQFDCVLLDVPCSGNPIADINWFGKRTINDVIKNARRQRQILAEAVKVTKEGGEIVYATCSMEPEENELNIDWAIRTFNLTVERVECHGEKGSRKVFGKELDRSIENCIRIWPKITQGFFICKLRRGYS